MGIDIETWRARIGLYHAASVGRYLKSQCKVSTVGRAGHQSGHKTSFKTLLHFLITCIVALLYTDPHFVSPYCDSSMKFHVFDQRVLGLIGHGVAVCRSVVGRALAIPKSTLVALPLLLIISGDVEPNPGPGEDLELNIANLTNHLSQVNSKWYTIGIQLKIDPSKLKEFETNFPSDCGRSLTSVLEFWLNKNTDTPVTWQMIVDVLKSPAVDENGLAKEIERLYCLPAQPDSDGDPEGIGSKGEFSEEYDKGGHGWNTKLNKQKSSLSVDEPYPRLSDNLPRAIQQFCEFEKAFKGLVMSKETDTSRKDKHGFTPFHLACKLGGLYAVKILVQKMKESHTLSDVLTMYSNDGRTPLHLASYFGHLDIVKYLISDPELKCDPDIPTRDNGITPLNFAARGGHMDIVKYLIEDQHRNPMAKNKNYHNTSLHHAAQFGHLEAVKYFIEIHKCSPFQKGFEDAIPLHLACESGHLEVVKYLLDEELLQKYGKTIKEVLEVQEKYGRTPLHLAAYHRGHLDVAKYLIEELKCDPNILTPELQMTPLHFASMRGYVSLIKFLVTNKYCDPIVIRRLVEITAYILQHVKEG